MTEMTGTSGMTGTADEWLARLAQSGPLGDQYGYDTLAPDWSVQRPNGLPEHLVYLVVTGSGSGSVAGMRTDLSPGCALWVPPRTPFRLGARGATPLSLYRFRLREPTVPPRVAPFLLVDNGWELRPALDALIQDLDGAAEFGDVRSRALLVVVLATLLRYAGQVRREPAPPGEHPLPAEQRDAIEDYADAHVGERPSVRELAAVVDLSAEQFRRRFRDTYRVSARSWLLRRRIHAAARRLDDTDEPVGVIAGHYGYSDVFLFSRQFKTVVGLSPRAWRTRATAPPDADLRPA